MIRNIIIVDCLSTGVNFISDIIRRNYNPIVLEVKFKGNPEDYEQIKRVTLSSYDSIDDSFDLIYEKDSFEETLEMVKKLDPLLVLPGSESGVVLATKLANALGLISNPVECLPAMTLKNEMQNALAKAGIRSIRGKLIHSLEEAIEYYEESGFDEVVVKPARNSGSYGVSICSNKQELCDAVNNTLGDSGIFGDGKVGLVIQEKITGTEYIVNTVSCNGVHRVTTIWKYSKIRTTEGAYIYNYMESVNELDISNAEMIEYAYQVADAIGIKFGPIHGEYMIDENGPVLIEVNCRPCGGSMPAKFLDNLSGQHETDSVLDSYLNPKRFEEERRKRYRLYSYAGLKFFIVPSDILAKSAPMEHIATRLPSHFKTSLTKLDGSSKYFPKTYDLETNGGIIYLNHKDKSIVQKDLDYLRSVEHHAFSQVLSVGLDKSNIKPIDNPGIIRNLLIKYESQIPGTVLLITEKPIENIKIVQCSINNLQEVPTGFDSVVLDLDESITEKDDSEISLLILNIVSKIKTGGLLVIPEKTYQYIVGGRNGMESLVKALNLRIEVPPYEIKNTIFASRT